MSPKKTPRRTKNEQAQVAGHSQLAEVRLRETHETNLGFMNFHLETLPEDVAKGDALVLAGELDDNLPVIFNGESFELQYLATVKYYFQNAPASVARGLLGKAAAALANLFRLIGPTGTTVTFRWEGVERTIPAQGHMDLQNGLQLNRGIILAVISGNEDARTYLARVPRDFYEHPDVRLLATDYARNAVLQSLARRDDATAARQLEELKKLQTPAGLGKSFDAYQKSAEPHTVDALDAILARDAQRCTRAIEGVLERHQKTFDSDKDLKRNAPEGFMSITALMLAQLAREHSIPITIQNRYLPLELLDAAPGDGPRDG